VDAHPKFERVAPVPFSAVCFRYKGSDAENQAIQEKINQSGRVFISGTVLNAQFVLRWPSETWRPNGAMCKKRGNCCRRRSRKGQITLREALLYQEQQVAEPKNRVPIRQALQKLL